MDRRSLTLPSNLSEMLLFSFILPPSRLNKFREFAVLARFPSTSTVPMDVKTRWSATYKILEVALKYRRVFERMVEESLPFMNYFLERNEKGEKRTGLLVKHDWENAEVFVHFLKKFYDASLELSASKSSTSLLIYQSMVVLQFEIEKRCKDDYDPTLKVVAMAMKTKFDKYWRIWDNMNLLIFISNILDLRNKLQMIKVCMRSLGGSHAKVQDFVDKVKKDMTTLWIEYKGLNDRFNIESQTMQTECSSGIVSSGTGGLFDELFD